MLKSYFLILFIFFFRLIGFSQERIAISGNITDTRGSALIGASIWFPNEETGTTTNVDGNFSIQINRKESYIAILSYIGFISDTILINYPTTNNLSFQLSEGLALKEVVISNQNEKAQDNYDKTRMGYVDLDIEEINNLPALLSENDVLKAIQLLPGIQSAEGAATGYYVRGGGSDQNLILLNNAVVYNPFHAAGFISVFNGDVVNEISIYKSGMPSNYGGRLSSLLNVNTKTPSFQEVKGSAGIGLVTARATVELPIIKNKLSILLSGRAFYSYALARALVPSEIKKELPQYYFYDFYGQANWKATKKDDFSFFHYSGKDLVDFQDKSTVDSTRFSIPWSNTVSGISWKHKINERIIATTSAYRSKYDFKFGADYTYGGQSLHTTIVDWGAKINISHAAKKHYLNYGIDGSYKTITPSVTKDVANSASSPNTRVADVTQKYSPLHFVAYFNDDWSIKPRFGINYGIRLGLFKEGEQYYIHADPKIITRFNITDKSSIKASYSYANQFIHLLVNSTATTPLDLWVSSSSNIKPQKAHSTSLGWFQNFKENQYELSVEGYYKHFKNQIEYREGTDVFSDINFDDKLTFGNGRSTGVEFLVRKREGKITGFAGYTLAWAQRQFNELSDGDWFNYKFDRRHDFTFSLNYSISERWSVSALFVVGSGHAITVPNDIYFTPRAQGNGGFTTDYGERNSFRLKAYHRLDLSVTYAGKPKKVQSKLKFDIYNVYNRANQFFVLLTSENAGRGRGQKANLREYSLIPILPSVSYQMEF